METRPASTFLERRIERIPLSFDASHGKKEMSVEHEVVQRGLIGHMIQEDSGCAGKGANWPSGAGSSISDVKDLNPLTANEQQ